MQRLRLTARPPKQESPDGPGTADLDAPVVAVCLDGKTVIITERDMQDTEGKKR